MEGARGGAWKESRFGSGAEDEDVALPEGREPSDFVEVLAGVQAWE